MLCWMCGKTRQDMIINDIYYRVAISLIVEKMVETGIRWFKHV